MGIDILGIDIMGVDILGIDIPALPPFQVVYHCLHSDKSTVACTT